MNLRDRLLLAQTLRHASTDATRSPVTYGRQLRMAADLIEKQVEASTDLVVDVAADIYARLIATKIPTTEKDLPEMAAVSIHAATVFVNALDDQKTPDADAEKS